MGDQAELHSEDWDGYEEPDYCYLCSEMDFDSYESACPDDLCHGGEVPCMHGDYTRLPCSACGN